MPVVALRTNSFTIHCRRCSIKRFLVEQQLSLKPLLRALTMVDGTSYPVDKTPELAVRQIFGRQKPCLVLAEASLLTIERIAMLGTRSLRRKPLSRLSLLTTTSSVPHRLFRSPRLKNGGSDLEGGLFAPRARVYSPLENGRKPHKDPGDSW